MKHLRKHNAGFTLVELVVAIAIATIVTAAATSVLLMGLRINRQTGDTASRQITVRTLLNTVEDIIAEGNIAEIKSNTESWSISDGNKVLLSYLFDDVEEKGTVYVGSYEYLGKTDTDETVVPILTDLLSSYVEMYDGLFTIYVETKDGMFSSSVYCRKLASGVGEYENMAPGDASEVRKTFIEKLRTQYRSRGAIRVWDDTKKEYVDSDTYYSEWYIEGYEGHSGWNEKTPWCACYISWALSQPGVAEYLTAPKKNWYANVDDFMEYFTTVPNDATSTWIPGGGIPTPGDLIFFDWNGGINPQHVGVVLKVTDRMVYTIEGNSAGRVTVRSYPLTDKRIIGYGVLF